MTCHWQCELFCWLSGEILSLSIERFIAERSRREPLVWKYLL